GPRPRDAGEDPARDRARQNRDEGGRLDEGVAGDELVLVEMLREDAVLDRPEQGRVRAHEEQDREQQRRAAGSKRERTDRHEQDLDELDEADEPRLVELFRQLAGRGREEEERRDEERGAQVYERIRRERPGHGPEGEQDDERVPEDVVVERAEELGPEEGAEAAKSEETERAGRRRHR